MLINMGAVHVYTIPYSMCCFRCGLYSLCVFLLLDSSPQSKLTYLLFIITYLFIVTYLFINCLLIYCLLATVYLTLQGFVVSVIVISLLFVLGIAASEVGAFYVSVY